MSWPKTMATKISHKVKEYRNPSPPYLGNIPLGTFETTFFGQKTFRLGGGSQSWSETPHFHKGGPYE